MNPSQISEPFLRNIRESSENKKFFNLEKKKCVSKKIEEEIPSNGSDEFMKAKLAQINFFNKWKLQFMFVHDSHSVASTQVESRGVKRKKKII